MFRLELKKKNNIDQILAGGAKFCILLWQTFWVSFENWNQLHIQPRLHKIVHIET